MKEAEDPRAITGKAETEALNAGPDCGCAANAERGCMRWTCPRLKVTTKVFPLGAGDDLMMKAGKP
jgi:hypothetical protein